ncbi:MAG: hypothetical protein EBZ47_06700 [Chlamydiae bacterium]|nr:hypothetical protein [Chlamydiota bacterium]
MSNMKKYLLLILPLIFSLFYGCSSQSKDSLKPKVLVSIPPYIYFVEKIAGDFVSVSSLAPEGSNPHLFEPNPRQIQDVYDSKVWIRLGESFEKKIASTLSYHHKNLIVVNLSETVPLLRQEAEHKCKCHHHEEAMDLHIWMSPSLAKLQAAAIKDALLQAFPDQEENFLKNFAILVDELDQLHIAISKKLAPFKNQSLIVSHPAFGYFCEEFGLKQISIEVEGKDPRPKDIEKVVETSTHSCARLVLIQEQYNNKGALAIAEKLQLPWYSVDPYSKDYPKTLNDITYQLSLAQ